MQLDLGKGFPTPPGGAEEKGERPLQAFPQYLKGLKKRGRNNISSNEKKGRKVSARREGSRTVRGGKGRNEIRGLQRRLGGEKENLPLSLEGQGLHCSLSGLRKNEGPERPRLRKKRRPLALSIICDKEAQGHGTGRAPQEGKKDKERRPLHLEETRKKRTRSREGRL